MGIDFLSPVLRKKLDLLIGQQPGTFAQLMMTPNIGGKTIRALSLSERTKALRRAEAAFARPTPDVGQ